MWNVHCFVHILTMRCTGAKFGWASLMSKMMAKSHGRRISLPFVLFAGWRELRDLKSSSGCKGDEPHIQVQLNF
jgi:hypothetical protein